MPGNNNNNEIEHNLDSWTSHQIKDTNLKKYRKRKRIWTAPQRFARTLIRKICRSIPSLPPVFCILDPESILLPQDVYNLRLHLLGCN